jgi:hypothetical protein
MQDDLFGDVTISKKKRKETWEISQHCCKICFGKILTRQVSPTVTECKCAECGVSTYGSVLNLCWCGKTAGQIYGRIFRCKPNDNPRPELPNLILVEEIPVVLKQLNDKPNRYCHIPDSF